jgi:2-methylisocitrate lyase-like PEP mutase family enzyme
MDTGLWRRTSTDRGAKCKSNIELFGRNLSTKTTAKQSRLARSATMSISDARAAFRKLHDGGCFVIPNPWDVGTARYLRHCGFKALATTSAGAAFSMGLPDTDWAVTRDTMLAHIRTIVEASELPVNADFESGYAHEPEAVAENVRLCVATGVAGLSIEDATGDTVNPLYDLDTAVARMRAARRAIDQSGADVMLVGRAECFLVGRPDLAETIARLDAYASAGADCLYAPGIRTAEQIAAVVTAVAPKPVNVLMSAATGLTVADLANLGVRRISVGSALARVAWGAFMRAAREIATEGRFDAFADAVPWAEINGFFRDDQKERGS